MSVGCGSPKKTVIYFPWAMKLVKFHRKFQQGLWATHLPDALCLSKALWYKIRYWGRMEISTQELVGRIANTDCIRWGILFQT